MADGIEKIGNNHPPPEARRSNVEDKYRELEELDRRRETLAEEGKGETIDVYA